LAHPKPAASQAADQEDVLAALIHARAVQASYPEYALSFASLPISMNELGEAESNYQNNLTAHLDIEPLSGAIMLGFSTDFGANQWLAQIAHIGSNGLLNWTCKSTVPESLFDGTACFAALEVDELLGPIKSTALYKVF